MSGEMSMQGEGVVVCVTGASGIIGSWLVNLLLARGYIIHWTVRNLKDEKEMKHLESLEGTESRLRLFQIDLLDFDSIAAAINGCVGVFHLASPCSVDHVHDPQNELLDPAIKGTLNVLTAAKELEDGLNAWCSRLPSPLFRATPTGRLIRSKRRSAGLILSTASKMNYGMRFLKH